MRIEKRHIHFYKVMEGNLSVMYRSSLGYIIHVDREEGAVDFHVEFTLNAFMKETELISETLRRWERARKIYKELLESKDILEKLLNDRPLSFMLTIETFTRR